MNLEYLEDKDMVNINLSSHFGINGEINLPLSLVEDLMNHINAFDGVVKYPLNSVVFHALMVYMDYINCDIVSFDEVKPFIVDCTGKDMQEIMVE